MKHLCVAAIVTFTSLIPQEAFAAPTGNRLYEQCTSDQRSATYWYDDAACTAYIQGFIEGATSFQELWPAETPKAICLPATVTAGQMRDVVVKYLAEHPERRHLSAMASITSAAMRAFPC